MRYWSDPPTHHEELSSEAATISTLYLGLGSGSVITPAAHPKRLHRVGPCKKAIPTMFRKISQTHFGGYQQYPPKGGDGHWDVIQLNGDITVRSVMLQNRKRCSTYTKQKRAGHREFPLWLSENGSANTNLSSIQEDAGSILGITQGSGIRHCHEPWCRLRTWLGSGIAVAVV